MTEINYKTTMNKELKHQSEECMSVKEAPLKVEWRDDGQLWAGRNGDEKVVLVNRCFPWSDPDEYISLRDTDEKEVALIRELSELDRESRHAVERALAEAGFYLEIEEVIAIEEDFEIRNWSVVTRQGSRQFQTKLDDWPINLSGGRLLIRDVAGDLFCIEDPERMNERSRKLIWAFVG